MNPKFSMDFRVIVVGITVIVVLGALAFTSPASHAQQTQKPPAKPWERNTPPPPTGPAVPGLRPPAVPGAPRQQPPPNTPPATSPATAAVPAIARVEGRPITQRDYDRLAEPYFARLRAQMGDAFTADVRKTAAHNVLNELIRRELLVIEAQRAKLQITEADIDQILSQDPFFYTDGKFDPAKLAQFKISPQSNYHQIGPRLREVALAEKFDRQLKTRLAPAPAAVRAEWSKRNEQIRFQYLPITTRDVSLEPGATEDEQRAYYAAHPDQFEKKARIGLRFVRLPLPAENDSMRASEQARQLARARDIADSLRRGTPIDSFGVTLDGVSETGLFELPATNIPSLGRPDEIVQQLGRAETDTTVRVFGPSVIPTGVVVAVATTREPKRVPAFGEVLGEVKRRADAEKRRTQLEADKLAYFESHRADFRSARASATRVVLKPAAVNVKDPSKSDITRWYERNGRTLFAGDSARAANPPALTDSVRDLVRVRLIDEARNQRVAQSLGRIATGLQRNPRGVWNLARAENAKADTLTLWKDGPRDSVFTSTLVDSLLGPPGAGLVGTIQGPRAFGAYEAVWRIDAVDSAFVPSFEASRSRVERAFQEDRRKKDEDEGKVYFEAHRADYKTKPKFVVDYVQVKIPSLDSVQVSDAELRKFWEQHQRDRFHQEEQVRARHILISTRPDASPVEIATAKARADSLRQATLAGADFAELARKFSADPGSGAQGGDLGFFDRPRMVKEFSDSAFAIPVGTVSQPVKTRFGWHLIKTEEKRAEGVRPFDEVRAEILRELGTARADSLGLRAAHRMRRQISSAGALAAAKASGGVQTSSPIAATDPLPGVGMVPELGTDLRTSR